MPSSKPSLTELRRVAQPPGLVGRRSAEHWAGRLYMRRWSLRVTRALLPLPVTPNGLTLLMLAVGIVAAAVATVVALWAALLAAVLIQVYLLLDCVDGEVARWRRTTSPAGVYLDRLGHYTVEAALVAAVGVRADGGPGAIAGWTLLALVGAVLVVLSKVETDLVVVARASSGLPPAPEGSAEPRPAGLRDLRRLVGRAPVHRIVGAVELSLLLVVAAVVDAVVGSEVATQVLVAAVAAVALVVAVGHPVSILASDRLR